KNNCLRTFIDIKMAPAGEDGQGGQVGQGRPGGPEGPAPVKVAPANVASGFSRTEPAPAPVKFVSKVPKAADEQRLIIATCEKGTVEDVNEMRGIKAGLDSMKKANPNFVEIAANDVWHARRPERVADPLPSRAWTKAARRRLALMQRREVLRIG